MNVTNNLGQNGLGVFMGAYAQRQQKSQKDGLAISKEQSDRIRQGIKNALHSSDILDRSAKVSISKTDIDFLCSEESFLKMKRDAEELYAANAVQKQNIAAGRNSGDVFWNNTGDQWLTFSKALAEGGFYDEMNDEEVGNFEGLLEQITSGMDDVSKSQYNTGIDFGTHESESNFFMTSTEAVVALESSTAALRYVSDKLLLDTLKGGFNSLIAIYQKHNEEILSEYNNPMESFDKMVANINKSGNAHIAEKPVEEYKYTVSLGNIRKTEEEKESFRGQISDAFKGYGASNDRKALMGAIKEQFERFVTNNSEDEGFRRYVSEKSSHLFDSIEGYWRKLIGIKNTVSI